MVCAKLELFATCGLSLEIIDVALIFRQWLFSLRHMGSKRFYTLRNSNQSPYKTANEQANAVPKIQAKYHILHSSFVNKRYVDFD